MTLNITVLEPDDEDYSKLVFSIIGLLEHDLETDCPMDSIDSKLIDQYAYMVADILQDPFHVEHCFSYPIFSTGFDHVDVSDEIEIIYLAIENWLDEMARKHRIDTLLDVKVNNYNIIVIGEKNVRQKITFNGVVEWNTRFVQRNSRPRDVGLRNLRFNGL